MAINFAAANTAGLNNPGTEIITLVKDGSSNFINPPNYDKMLAYLSSGEVPMLFVTAEGGETGSLYQLVEHSETENKIRFSNSANAIEFCAGAVAPAVSNVVPKPLTYDYMPEGYPKKSGWSIEWDGNTDGLTSVDSSGAAYYRVSDVVLTHDDLIGATVEYSDGSNEVLTSGDVSDMSEDVTSGIGMVVTVRQDNSTADDMLFPLKGTYLLYDHGYHATRVIKQTIMPMADEFLPNIPADKLPASGSSSGQLIVIVYSTNLEGTIFEADKTYNEIRAAIESGMSVVIHYKENINATDYRVFYHTKIMNGYYQFCSVEELAGSVFFWYISIHEENGEMGINKQSLRLQVVTT